MPDPDAPQGFLGSLPRKVFDLTGFHIFDVLKFGVVLLIAAVGIAWMLLSSGADQDSKNSAEADLAPKQLTSKEKFRDLSMMPGDFRERLAVEKIGILNAKIETGEELANSGGDYADQASEMLLFLYGTRCSLEEAEGLESEKTYRRLAQLRQSALATGNQGGVATADFLRAIAATNRLKRRPEIADFRFASDAIINLDSKNLLNIREARKLYLDAVELHSKSTEKSYTAIFLSLVADKLIGSPENEVANLGRNLKDYPTYIRFYEAVNDLPYSSHEAKVKFYDELFADLNEFPPQSPTTYRVIIKLLDRLVNRSDLKSASTMVERLAKAASMLSPEIKVKFDQSIEKIETRIAALGKTIDISGSAFNETPLQLPNGKPTTIVFWRPSEVESLEHVILLAESEWFDPWASNVLVACPASLGEEDLKAAALRFNQLTVLDNATSRRLADEMGIDLVPYHVSLDKDNKVIRLGTATD